jgi:APA family basic amino acid/polyamine antiporter
VAGVFGALMALAIVSTVNAMITIGPRVYYAMAKDGAFLPAAARVSPGSRVPIAAVVCQGACAMFMTFTSVPQLVPYIGFGLTFFRTCVIAVTIRCHCRFSVDNCRQPAAVSVYDFTRRSCSFVDQSPAIHPSCSRR